MPYIKQRYRKSQFPPYGPGELAYRLMYEVKAGSEEECFTDIFTVGYDSRSRDLTTEYLEIIGAVYTVIYEVERRKLGYDLTNLLGAFRKFYHDVIRSSEEKKLVTRLIMNVLVGGYTADDYYDILFYYAMSSGHCYATYNLIIGAVEMASRELTFAYPEKSSEQLAQLKKAFDRFYTEVIAPYEDTKLKENGDV